MDEFQKIRFNHYKSFNGEEDVEIGMTDKISLIIGRNNSGKSSVVDVVEFLYNDELFYKNRDTDIKALCKVIEQMIPDPEDDITYFMYSNSDYFIRRRFLGCSLWAKIEIENANPYRRNLNLSEVEKEGKRIDIGESEQIIGEQLLRQWNAYDSNVVFRRINAERDIVPESENASANLDYSGDGATNLIRKFINDSRLDERKVEHTLLGALNTIMGNDSCFEEIRIQQIQAGSGLKWEIFLKETGLERFALSKSGSGLKTIILVLINLYLLPELKKEKKYVYVFEELENNLHPALQRRLFEFLYGFAQKHDVKIFLTSHSHVAINTFYGKDKAQIYHVIKEGATSSLKKIDTYFDKAEILDDLDVKASDLLQSNGIIWVEGPSDRVYIKRWLEVFCDCKFEEGKDYQFLYYGGRLLAHYEANEKDEINGLINVLTTNRNAAIVIDSDKKDAKAEINKTKQRIQEEFESKGYFCWITAGKEIENYVTAQSINATYGSEIKNNIRRYALFPKYIKDVKSSFTSNKVLFAQEVCPNIGLDDSILDLKDQIQKLYQKITEWNRH